MRLNHQELVHQHLTHLVPPWLQKIRCSRSTLTSCEKTLDTFVCNDVVQKGSKRFNSLDYHKLLRNHPAHLGFPVKNVGSVQFNHPKLR